MFFFGDIPRYVNERIETGLSLCVCNLKRRNSLQFDHSNYNLHYVGVYVLSLFEMSLKYLRKKEHVTFFFYKRI